MRHDIDIGSSGAIRHCGAPNKSQNSCRDLHEFSDWLHVISDLIMVKVFAGSNDKHKEVFKASIVDTLRTEFMMTLTCATNSCTISTSQVNIPAAAMTESLYTFGP